jgi:integrase/recombinase XerC
MTLKIITPDQEKKLFELEIADKWKLIYSLMLHNGLRVGEVVQLKWTDFFDEQLQKIRLLVRPEITKTKSFRIVPLHNKTKILLKNFYDIDEYMHGQIPAGYMFKSESAANYISIRHIQRMIAAHSFMAFGEKTHPHMLRHTYATNLMSICNIRIVQELLGHKSLQSTQVYTHPNISDLDKAVANI